MMRLIKSITTKKPALAVLTLALCLGFSVGGAPAYAQETISPPGASASPVASDSLPQAPGEIRSPGLNLPPQPSANAGVTAPTAAQIARDQEKLEKQIREQAFEAAITGLLPLKPDEIREVLRRFDETRQAVEVPIYPYPQPEIAVETVALDPGAVPPTIKVAVNHVTTVNIVDVTGAPWPIQDMSWAGNFDILQPENGGNIFRITPLSDFTYGNMSMRLVGLPTPISFILKTQRDSVQYRLDVRVPEFGPMSAPPIVEGGLSIVAGDSSSAAVLEGVPPGSAERLDVTGVDGRTTAYNIGDKTYVRTPLTLLSPSWSNSVSSADGMNVYTVSNAPILLLSDKGRVVRARLSSRNESDDE